jgi:hypothetical protein
VKVAMGESEHRIVTVDRSEDLHSSAARLRSAAHVTGDPEARAWMVELAARYEQLARDEPTVQIKLPEGSMVPDSMRTDQDT